MMLLNRIIIFGKDISGLKHFYQSNFDLSLIEEIEGEWVVFNAGSIEIAFHRIGADYRNEELFRAESNIKLVFGIDDINNFRNILLNKDVEMKEIKSLGDSDSLFCDGQDIEGNVFQLHQKK
jgi:predicted enzyme related to lactoylglutathione lyase